MGSLGWPEILIILVIALIIFGPRKLPELGKSLGQSLAQFRRASEDFKRTWEEEVEIEKRKLEAPFTTPPDYTATADNPYEGSDFNLEGQTAISQGTEGEGTVSRGPEDDVVSEEPHTVTRERSS